MGEVQRSPQGGGIAVIRTACSTSRKDALFPVGQMRWLQLRQQNLGDRIAIYKAPEPADRVICRGIAAFGPQLVDVSLACRLDAERFGRSAFVQMIMKPL